jgi:hypothetical protein
MGIPSLMNNRDALLVALAVGPLRFVMIGKRLVPRQCQDQIQSRAGS